VKLIVGDIVLYGGNNLKCKIDDTRSHLAARESGDSSIFIHIVDLSNPRNKGWVSPNYLTLLKRTNIADKFMED